MSAHRDNEPVMLGLGCEPPLLWQGKEIDYHPSEAVLRHG
jgi:hypothetical protein